VLGWPALYLPDRFSSAPGKPIPAACVDWAATKAAYRFFDNPRVTEHAVLAGHFAATRTRFDGAPGPILILQDTTEFNFKAIKALLSLRLTLLLAAQLAQSRYPRKGGPARLSITHIFTSWLEPIESSVILSVAPNQRSGADERLGTGWRGFVAG
jgi:hypothetical protein